MNEYYDVRLKNANLEHLYSLTETTALCMKEIFVMNNLNKLWEKGNTCVSSQQERVFVPLS